MKIKAYTLMEVTIAMLLSAICISICYTAYDMVAKYYVSFQQRNESAYDLLALKRVMTNDMFKANRVYKTSTGFQCEQDSASIAYFFQDREIIRQLNSSKADTFKMAWLDLSFSFESADRFDADTLDRVAFKVEVDKSNIIPFIFYKHYSAQNLFQ